MSRMRTLGEVVSRIYANTRPDGGCLVSTLPSLPHGRVRVRLRGKLCYAHRAVAEYYLGPCPEGKEVRHLLQSRT